MMETDDDVMELLLKWEDVYSQGQNLPAEELCSDPAVAVRLQKQIDRLVKFREICGDLTQTETASTQETVDNSVFNTASSFAQVAFHDRGGRGEIYKARHVELRRLVALKFLNHDARFDQELRDRFQFEAEATSQLDHPGVAPVYSFGSTSDGRPFYSMRFIRGNSLEDEIAAFHATPWTAANHGEKHREFNRLIRHLVSAARTIAYAHQRGILNLDVKPRNIMVGKYGETLVIDWGEATPLTNLETSHLRTEGPLPSLREREGTSSSFAGGGTLAYMAPERLPDATGTIGLWTDVYSLGVCLYRLITGTEAFGAASESRNQVIERIRTGKFRAPESARAETPRALAAIARKAMALDAAQRYPTAQLFADDIEAWLDNEPVSAYRESRVERVSRWSRRHRGARRTAIVSMLTLLAVSVVSAFFLSASRNRAAAASKDCLHLGAESTAELVARDFELRWRVLESLAADASLVKLAGDASAEAKSDEGISLNTGSQAELQQYLKGVFQDWKDYATADSMLLVDAEGTMLARYPDPDDPEIIGRSYAYRDYFHGEDHDFPRDNVPKVKPIQKPHVSVALRSTANKRLRVQFSVPVRDKKGVVGVLGMAVVISEFNFPKDKLRPLVLIDLRPTVIDQVKRSNLILHHPLMEREELKFTSDESLIKKWNEMTDERNLTFDRESAWSDNYIDPLDGSSWRAAFAPVHARDKDGDPLPLRLVVVAQERID